MKFRSFPLLFIFSFLSVTFFCCEEVTKSADKKIDQLVLTVGGTDTPVTFDADYNASLTVPFGTDLTAITIKTLLVSAKATSSVAQGDVLTLTSGSVAITVTAEDGSKQVYTLQVTIAPAPPRTGADITALTATISGQAYSTTGDNPAVVITDNAIAIMLPFGIMLPTRLSLTGLTLSAGALSVPVMGATLNLVAGSGMITVTAEDGMTTRVYTVQVTVAAAPRTGANITALTATISNQSYSSTGDNALVTIADNSIAITLPFNMTLPSSLSLTGLTLSAGASSVPSEGATLILTAGAGTIDVTAEDGMTMRPYTVRVTIATAPLTGTAITAFTATIGGQTYSTTGDDPAVVITDESIAITLPFGNTLPASLPLTVLSLSPGASSVPAEGASLDLAAGVGTINVTAEDGTTMGVYTVRVTIATPRTGTDITAFTATILGESYSNTGDNALVTIMNNAISIILPAGSMLPSSLSLTVLSLSAGASSIPAEGSTLALTAGVGTLTVRAENGMPMRVYTVQVTIAVVPLTGTAITAFTVTIGGEAYSTTGDDPAVVITDESIAITLPFGSALPASLPLTVLSLSPGASSTPAEGATLSLTSGAATINVTAEDGTTTRAYTVRVTIALRTGAMITAFTATIGGQTYSSTGDNPAVVITDNAITIMLPLLFGSSLPASLTLTALTLSPGASSTPAQGATLTLTAAGAGTISVQAEDPNVMASYTVSVISRQPVVTTYTGTDTLGIAVRDVVTEAGRSVSFSAMDTVIMVSGLADVSFDWALGMLSGTKTAMAGTLVLTQSDLAMFPSMADVTYVLTVSANGQTSEEKALFYYPGQLRTWRDLQGMRVNLAGTYRMMRDIDFPDADGDGVSAYNFEPLGRDTDVNANFFQGTAFSGTFDGGGHSVNYLYIDRRAENYVGLFGRLTGTVRNVGLVGGTVTGGEVVGGLMGQNAGTLQGAYATGSVTGVGGSTGGLVGTNSGTLQGAYATGTVTGGANSFPIGGLVGINSGTIQGAYSTGAVTGPTRVGGLVGINGAEGMITGVYATGVVTGNTFRVGGLVGSNTGVAVGYARGNVIRLGDSMNADFGRLFGSQNGEANNPSRGYYSSQTGESQLLSLAADDTSTPLTGTTGFDGEARTSASAQADFTGFEFGEEIGQWIYTAGRWPALNLGGLQSAAEQPTQ